MSKITSKGGPCKLNGRLVDHGGGIHKGRVNAVQPGIVHGPIGPPSKHRGSMTLKVK